MRRLAWEETAPKLTEDETQHEKCVLLSTRAFPSRFMLNILFEIKTRGLLRSRRLCRAPSPISALSTNSAPCQSSLLGADRLSCRTVSVPSIKPREGSNSFFFFLKSINFLTYDFEKFFLFSFFSFLNHFCLICSVAQQFPPPLFLVPQLCWLC